MVWLESQRAKSERKNSLFVFCCCCLALLFSVFFKIYNKDKCFNVVWIFISIYPQLWCCFVENQYAFTTSFCLKLSSESMWLTGQVCGTRRSSLAHMVQWSGAVPPTPAILGKQGQDRKAFALCYTVYYTIRDNLWLAFIILPQCLPYKFKLFFWENGSVGKR